MLSTATWTAVVNKKYLTSSTFKALDVAVKAYIGEKNSLPNLVKTWNAWTKKFHDKRQTYKNSDRYVVGGALDDIAALVGSANSGGALVVLPAGKPGSGTGVRSNIPTFNPPLNVDFPNDPPSPPRFPRCPPPRDLSR